MFVKSIDRKHQRQRLYRFTFSSFARQSAAVATAVALIASGLSKRFVAVIAKRLRRNVYPFADLGDLHLPCPFSS